MGNVETKLDCSTKEIYIEEDGSAVYAYYDMDDGRIASRSMVTGPYPLPAFIADEMVGITNMFIDAGLHLRRLMDDR